MFPIDVDTATEILEQIGDGLLIIDNDLNIKYINKTLAKSLGYTKKQLLGKSFTKIYCKNCDIDIIEKYVGEKRQRISPRYTGKLISKENKLIEIEFSLKAATNKKLGYQGVIMFVIDISKRIELEERIKETTMKDILTGLHNQNYFFEFLDKEMEIAARYNRPISMIYIDLDNFKECNDTYGHQFGDKILRYCSEIINSTIRKSDEMFRYGGDEFVILLPETPLKKAEEVGKKIIEIFDKKIKNIFNYNSLKPISLSIGICQLKKDGNSHSFLKRADMAMYKAKKVEGSAYIISK